MNDVQPCQASAEVGSLADASNDERLVLSSILSGKYPEVMTDARRTLYPQDFNNSGYRWIFYICRTLHDEGCPINLSAVVLRAGQLSAQDGACGMALLAAEYSREVLGDEPTRCASEPIASGSVLEVIGDPKAFDPLTSAALDRPFFDHAMMRVRDAALRRHWIAALADFTGEVQKSRLSVQEVTRKCIARLARIATKNRTDDIVSDSTEVLNELMGRMREGMGDGETVLERICKPRERCLRVFAGNERACVWPFVLSIARQIASGPGDRPGVLIFSLRADRHNIAAALIAADGVPSLDANAPHTLPEADFDAFEEAAKRFKNLRLRIVDWPLIGIDELCTIAQSEIQMREGRLGLIVVRGLGDRLLRPDQVGQRTVLAGYIEKLRNLAYNFRVPVFATVTLPHQGDDTRKPIPVDLDGKGHVADMATSLVLLHPMRTEKDTDGWHTVELNLAKDEYFCTGSISVEIHQTKLQVRQYSRE